MTRLRTRALVALAALAAAALAAPAAAQHAPARDSTAHITWRDRVAVSARYGAFRPAGGSELYALLDRALDPGAGALRPDLLGGTLHVQVTNALGLVMGAERGSAAVASVSRTRPASAAGAVSQRTTLDLPAVATLGAEWRALRWRGAGARGDDRLRLVLGAGGGVARYRLRQWGDFVDAERGVAFADDLRSTGQGAIGWASAGVDIPVRRWVAVQGEVRRQLGSAPMSADYASFDRLDLGGTRFGVGLLFHPGRAGR